MDTNIVEVRKTITLYSSFDSATIKSLDNFINVEFIPDELIVRSVTFMSTVGGNPILINSSICPYFSVPMHDTKVATNNFNQITPSIYYKVTNPINGNYRFSFVLLNGNPIDNRGNSYFSMVLEFVKYKSVNPQKIY